MGRLLAAAAWPSARTEARHERVATGEPSFYPSPDQTPGKAMTNSDAVLAANLEFYRAFTARDLAAMEMLWAHRVPVACLHPGWTALKDRTAIMESWESILSDPDAPRVACFDEQVFLYGDVALVLCEEELDSGTLAATNLFVREDNEWRIAHHHAGQIVRRHAPVAAQLTVANRRADACRMFTWPDRHPQLG